MSRNYGTATLKNHIANAAPGTLAAMGQMFGISQNDFFSLYSALSVSFLSSDGSKNLWVSRGVSPLASWRGD